MARKPQLELHLTVGQGREPEAARFLLQELVADHRAILVALAAEVVSQHEAETQGRAILVVAGADQVERVQADLGKLVR